MIYPDVPLDTWCKKWNLKPRNKKCKKCGNLFLTNRPVYIADCVGLESELHECGDSFVSVILKPRTKLAISFWNKVKP